MDPIMAGDSYYENPRHEMLPYVPTGTRAVLDIGCGAGAFAGLVKGRSAEAPPEIWGIEMDPTAAALAGENLDRIMVGDAHDILPGLPTEKFDCVVLNDVLEHLLEPGELLARLRPALKPNAVIVASIPNVRYFFNVVDLAVHGRWDYTDEGILDRTHLRFFTRASMARMFQEAGYTVDQTVGINPTGSAKFKLVNLLTLGRWSDMRYLQFAIVARLSNGQG
jgi:2-polyprenyl-3-methyl-5-hydroxy-6-metoxy-1,4-benzoquinol methylase